MSNLTVPYRFSAYVPGLTLSKPTDLGVKLRYRDHGPGFHIQRGLGPRASLMCALVLDPERSVFAWPLALHDLAVRALHASLHGLAATGELPYLYAEPAPRVYRLREPAPKECGWLGVRTVTPHPEVESEPAGLVLVTFHLETSEAAYVVSGEQLVVAIESVLDHGSPPLRLESMLGYKSSRPAGRLESRDPDKT
jgi:hypothetical protein